MNDAFDAPIGESVPPLTAGVRLREGRLAAGWSIDAVAQQLKLAPRQVRALEDDDFALLPGRTFVRGFVRNYARLLRLDADALLATLPDAVAAPSLDATSLPPSPRVMGKMPAYLNEKPRPGRWAIPLALLVIAAIAAAYEYTREGSILGKAMRGENTARTLALSAPADPPPPSDAIPSAASALRNPLSTVTGSPPAAGSESKLESASLAPAPAARAAAGATDAQLVLVFRGTSWVEVKDGKGAIVLSTIGYPGAAHTVAGAPPLEVVLGNAEAVAVTYRGAAFDSTPHVKQNVAKFSLN